MGNNKSLLGFDWLGCNDRISIPRIVSSRDGIDRTYFFMLLTVLTILPQSNPPTFACLSANATGSGLACAFLIPTRMSEMKRKRVKVEVDVERECRRMGISTLGYGKGSLKVWCYWIDMDR